MHILYGWKITFAGPCNFRINIAVQIPPSPTHCQQTAETVLMMSIERGVSAKPVDDYVAGVLGRKLLGWL